MWLRQKTMHKLKLYDPSEFHVVNPSKKTRVGNPVGYKVVPGGTAVGLLDLDICFKSEGRLPITSKYG
ncbi:copper amine oxidase family protein [Actinidia rufa]|uniref:Copper amine oxidase family protein n=1 Tax=Actinidia rufa TaxID=165716 RepID=A0A7J0G833_9ERIC|nr:copper amine oxidase family protein [Actinidia rufa]